MKNLNQFICLIILIVAMSSGCADEVADKNETTSEVTESVEKSDKNQTPNLEMGEQKSMASESSDNQNSIETTLKPLSTNTIENQLISDNLLSENEIMKTASDSINAFTFDLYGKLREEEGNLFFSPYSISSALAMTYAGARGETEKQMAKTLHFDMENDIHSAFSKLTHTLSADDSEHYQLTIANALWRQVDEKFSENFIELLEKQYGAGKNTVDFKNDTEKARLAINEWTEENTQDKIKDLIKQGVLTNLTRLVLTNAIYFKGDWMFQFDEEKTRNMPFKRSKNDEVIVSMMNQKTNFLKYFEDDSFQAIELPYKSSKGAFRSEKSLAMVIILPKKIDKLPNLENQLIIERVTEGLANLKLHHGKIKIYLPKFKLSSGFSLKKVLIDLGMVDAFDYDKADFSGMNGRKDLAIAAAIHKAFVEVNEKGTEAAAATAIVMATRSVSPPALEFRADHPFLFLIKDNATGTILFMGRVVDPSAE